jgi:hypothetical protein
MHPEQPFEDIGTSRAGQPVAVPVAAIREHR